MSNWTQADIDAVYARRKAEAEGYLDLLPAKAKKRTKNKWEEAYAGQLELEKRAGLIRWYDFEPIRLRIGIGAWFKPDFAALTAKGSLEFREVKGMWREAARVRIKVAADRYPFRFMAVTKDRNTGEWVYEEFGK